MDDYENDQGWTPFLRRATEVVEENQLLKKNNEELQEKIKCFEYLQSRLFNEVVPIKEKYNEYQKRVRQLVEERACFPPEWEYFCTIPELSKKFDEYGHFKSFYGDTTVFPLSADVSFLLAGVQAELYSCAASMLSENLPPETFHITLHDLCSGEVKETVVEKVGEHNKVIQVLMDSVRKKGKVHLRSVGIVSMVSSSLVMLFEPMSDTDHNSIQRVNNIIDTIHPLSYPLTLHCTLAYYKPGIYSPDQWNCLRKKIIEMNAREPIEIEVDYAALEYQFFYSMKEYVNSTNINFMDFKE